jgi:hypothetical protein
MGGGTLERTSMGANRDPTVNQVQGLNADHLLKHALVSMIRIRYV